MFDYTKALILLENQMSLITQKKSIEAGLQQDGESVRAGRTHHREALRFVS